MQLIDWYTVVYSFDLEFWLLSFCRKRFYAPCFSWNQFNSLTWMCRYQNIATKVMNTKTYWEIRKWAIWYRAKILWAWKVLKFGGHFYAKILWKIGNFFEVVNKEFSCEVRSIFLNHYVLWTKIHCMDKTNFGRCSQFSLFFIFLHLGA